MDTLLIVTNNPAVEAVFRRHEFWGGYVISRQPDYLAVLLATRDAVHQGKHLLMHPESGSVLPGTTPYRSLVLENRISQLDMTSLEMIENALTRYHRFAAAGRMAEWPETVQQDFQFIDLSLLRQGIASSLRDTIFI